MNPLFGEETHQAELIVAGLVSGSGLIALVVKFLLSTPERETTAYKQGAADEHTRYQDEVKDLKVRITAIEEENKKLRNGLVRLAVATTLSREQKQEIANILGFKTTAQLLRSEIENE